MSRLVDADIQTDMVIKLIVNSSLNNNNNNNNSFFKHSIKTSLFFCGYSREAEIRIPKNLDLQDVSRRARVTHLMGFKVIIYI